LPLDRSQRAADELAVVLGGVQRGDDARGNCNASFEDILGLEAGQRRVDEIIHFDV
jgi:hypothetical protein